MNNILVTLLSAKSYKLYIICNWSRYVYEFTTDQGCYFATEKWVLLHNSVSREPPCLPPFWNEAEGASLHDSFSVFSCSFFRRSLRRPNHYYYRRSPRSHTRFFSLVHIPMHPPFARSPPPSAIDFGQANYIFSPVVERIKLWYSRPVSRRSPPASKHRPSSETPKTILQNS